LGLEGKFVVGYSGNMGESTSSRQYWELRNVRGDDSIVFLFIRAAPRGNGQTEANRRSLQHAVLAYQSTERWV
jgi:hypothetical protein